MQSLRTRSLQADRVTVILSQNGSGPVAEECDLREHVKKWCAVLCGSSYLYRNSMEYV